MTPTAGFPAALLARIVEAAPTGIAILDGAATIRVVNPAFTAIFGAAGCPGATLPDLFAEADVARLAALLSKAGDSAEASAPIAVRPRELADGTVLVQAVRGEGEMLLFATDVTAERRMARRLMVAEKLETVTQLAAGIAHDFNNLLTALVGHADLLLARYPHDHPAHGDALAIRKSAERAAGLVRDLFAFAGQSGARADAIAVAPFLDAVRPLLERILGPDVAVTSDIGADLPAVRAARAELEQAFVAIGRYAAAAMPRGGSFALAAGRIVQDAAGRPVGPRLAPGEYVLIRFADSGTPMNEAEVERIFEPFYSPRGPISGPGLGLAAAYGIVRQAGGDIFARRGESAGTVFDIYLPAQAAARPAPAPPSPAEKPAAAPRPGGGATVLVVEDEMPVRRFAVRALTLRGYTVIEAETGADALAVLDETGRRVDLVISDVMMPEMDGATLVREARERRPEVPILLISGYGPDVMRGVLDRYDNISFLPKPFSLDELSATVAGVLA